jgi:hypothetical protein
MNLAQVRSVTATDVPWSVKTMRIGVLGKTLPHDAGMLRGT